MTNSIPISAAIPKSSEPRAFASIEPGESTQIIEGQRPEAMALGLIENACELFCRRLDSVVVSGLNRCPRPVGQQWPSSLRLWLRLRHGSPEWTQIAFVAARNECAV